MKKILYILIAFVFLPVTVFGATATLNIDTESQNINVLEGTISVPANITVSSIQTGNSVVLIWIESPAFSTDTHQIHFSGLIPGGFIGEGKILSFEGNFSDVDISKFSVTNALALKNDGEGTKANVKFKIISGEVKVDTESPDPFSIIISEDTEVFGGKPFISFLAQDKNSGIDHYESNTSFFGIPRKSGWSSVTSPKVLTTADLWKKIYIKAIDKNGNERVSTINGPFYSKAVLLLSILCIICIVCVPFFRKRFSSSR